MKNLSVAEGIIPIARFKANASRIISSVHDIGTPVIITQQGKAIAVLVSPSDFDTFCETERFISATREGLYDVDAGRIVSHDKVTSIANKRYGE